MVLLARLTAPTSGAGGREWEAGAWRTAGMASSSRVLIEHSTASHSLGRHMPRPAPAVGACAPYKGLPTEERPAHWGRPPREVWRGSNRKV
jgi:hypothetical protein